MRDTRLSGWPRNEHFRLVLGMLALVVASSPAIAASFIDIDCTEGQPSLDQSIVLADELDISVVDLSPSSDQSLGAIEELSSQYEASAAPHLYLGPRVATIVRDVFGDELELPSDEPLEPAESPFGVGPAPVADSSNQDEPAIPVDGEIDDPVDAEFYSPLRIHREMYRTDI